MFLFVSSNKQNNDIIVCQLSCNNLKCGFLFILVFSRTRPSYRDQYRAYCVFVARASVYVFMHIQIVPFFCYNTGVWQSEWFFGWMEGQFPFIHFLPHPLVYLSRSHKPVTIPPLFKPDLFTLLPSLQSHSYIMEPVAPFTRLDLLIPSSTSGKGLVVWLLPIKVDSCRDWEEDEHT